MAGTTLLINVFLIDCAGNEPQERASVVVDGERITEVRLGESGPMGGHDAIIDCTGLTLMPGLTDAHVHVGAVDVNILDQHRERPSNLTALLMARVLQETLMQGGATKSFTGRWTSRRPYRSRRAGLWGRTWRLTSSRTPRPESAARALSVRG